MLHLKLYSLIILKHIIIENRRTFIKKTAVTTTGVSAASIFPFAIINKKKPIEDLVIGHGSHRYKVHKNWAQMSMVHTPLLNCHEMVMDQKGRLLMIGDHTENNILVFDKSGKLLDAWGTQYPGGHGLTLHNEGGTDVLFIVDCGWFQNKQGQWKKQAGQVVKTTTDGALIFNIGHPRTIGIYAEDQDFMPTEVAVAPNGDIYVADGYGSDYILQYNHKGEYIRHFGAKDSTNPEAHLSNAHGVAIDMRASSEPKLVVTSRNDQAFKYFTLSGDYLYTLHLPGAYVCRPVFEDENLYAGVCWSSIRGGKKRQANTGFVTIMDKDNKVISNPGGEAPEYLEGQLQEMYQSETRVFNHGHDVCIDDDKNVYVCQWNANKTPPIKLERV